MRASAAEALGGIGLSAKAAVQPLLAALKDAEPIVRETAAEALAAIPSLANLDISYTKFGDAGLKRLASLGRLKYLYLTDTKVSPEAAEAFHKQKSATFVSWARRPEPRATPKADPKAKPPEEF